MPNTIQRQAKTRRDSGELNRDQKRARERDANKPAPELGPGKWVRRGLQPAVEPSKPSGFSALMRLAAEIREEFDPTAKAKLEARYKVEAAALADLSLDPRELHLRELCAEVVSTFGGVTAADLDEPECWGRREWLAFHARLLICLRRSCHWLAVSRRFGCERWGESFLTIAEAKSTKAAP